MTERAPERSRLRAAFPWFGGKSRAAPLIWRALGRVDAYCEPFAGSLAVLLGNPDPPAVEVVNDLDAMICNFWRAVRAAPDDVAAHADWPVNEADLVARHRRVGSWVASVGQLARADADWYDARVAGWWVWGMSAWLGGGFGADASGGETRKPMMGEGKNSPGIKLHALGARPREWFDALAVRLRHVRILCGDWQRALTHSVIGEDRGVVGLVLDPPYDIDLREGGVYRHDAAGVAQDVQSWAIENAGRPHLRVALCAYDDGRGMPPGWTGVRWRATGGYGNAGSGRARENRHREVVWFSPSVGRDAAAAAARELGLDLVA